jgi:anti-anti-sigma factor
METRTAVGDGRITLRPQGLFGGSANDDFRDCCVSALDAREVIELEIDFAQVEHFHTAGLGMLLLLKERADLADKRVVLSHCGADLSRLLDIARLKQFFQVE